MPAKIDIPVLIAGAGPAGLMLAGELARHGTKCRIIDKAPAPTMQSRALAIHARTLEVFDALGIADEVIAAGHKVFGVTAYSGGRRLAHISFDGLESRFPYIVMLPQSETERILGRHLAASGIEVERNLELTGLAQDNDGVSAVIRPTAGGEPLSCRANWVVGCDGAHSAVRNSLGMKFEGAQYDEPFWLADTMVDFDQHDDEIYVYAAAESIVVLFPIAHGRWRVVVGGDECKDALAPTVEQIQAAMENAGVRGARAHDPIWLAQFRISRRRVENFSLGRVFLAGDSAHIHSPAGGQGMNTGLQDAFNLGWKLALADSGAARPELLATYNDERFPVSGDVLRETDLMTRAITMREPVGRAIRDRLAPVLSATDFVRRRASRTISEIAVNYRQSPIVGEHRAGLAESLRRAGGPGVGAWYEFGNGPAAGDRALDVEGIEVPGSAAHRLYEALRNPHFNLLLFAGVESAGDYRSYCRGARTFRRPAWASSAIPAMRCIARTARARAAYT
ncbi:MAG: FAD-dependent monooxygenase [Candidatus Binataceae bacterium]